MLGSPAKIPVPEWGLRAEGHAGWDGGHLFKLAILETWNQIVTIIPIYSVPCRIVEDCTTQRQ